ncbi:hypothetical protein ROZALSC1DRAFT_30664 [Rozella allomycis CSF55]|uniref:cytochrome-b5 reductase n=1 Tax=Rozella allomycis (strain CSF55) TaxID=988480 RepID=A0A4V1IZC1_ROZAC|nr:hypothetical protein ROZALSC1DRAFT_30664 [Rozella allomycis CSF55]
MKRNRSSHVKYASRIPSTFSRPYSNKQSFKSNLGLPLGIGAASILAGAYSYYKFCDYDKSSQESMFSPEEFRDFKVSKKLQISPNTYKITFQVPSDKAYKMPVSSFLLVKADINGETVVRPYTPVTIEEDGKYEFSMVVKAYPDGKLSSYIGNLKVGDFLSFKGPIGKFEYHSNEFKHIGMIAGGTGITPMFQVLQKAMRNPNDKTKFTLIFGNVTEDDILLRTDLEKLVLNNPERFNIVYLLDKPSPNWHGESGYVNEKLVKQYMPSPDDEYSKILICGPPGMVGAVCGPKAPDYSQGELSGLLAKLNYQKDQSATSGNLECIKSVKVEPESEEQLSLKKTYIVSVYFSLLYFGAQYFQYAAFGKTYVGSAAILMSTSAFFTLVIGAVCKLEKLTALKLASVIISVGGMIVLGREEFNQEGNLWIGNLCAILSALFYGLYSVLFKWFVPDESKIDPFLFFGLVGFNTMILIPPLLVFLHATGIETFYLPTLAQFGHLSINNLCCSVVATYLWYVAMNYTTPVVTAVALSLITPGTLLGEILINNVIPANFKIFSALLVTLAFILVNYASSHPQIDEKLTSRLCFWKNK